MPPAKPAPKKAPRQDGRARSAPPRGERVSARRHEPPRGHAPPIGPHELEAKKRGSLAQLLFRCARRLNERTLEGLRSRVGFAIRPAHTDLFPHIDLEGTPQTLLAERLGISKQAVHKRVTELRDAGLLEVEPDPADGRTTRVRFSSKRGRTLMDGLAVLVELDRELARTLGEARARALHDTLKDLDDWLGRA
ncbi:MAG: MarR family transcriptional regulator [Polyangiaceae bacterium]|nr:MarR family transcriptional regulator [Polyangiaceae bacterium]